jgi:hypothetical protein
MLPPECEASLSCLEVPHGRDVYYRYAQEARKEFVQMKHGHALGASVLVVVLILVVAAPTAALPDSLVSMNARMMRFQEKPAIIHIMIGQDDGRSGIGPASVDVGQPLLFGFEWTCVDCTVADLQGDADNASFTVSVDGGEPMDIVGFYQPAFEAETQSGPAWTWDHDGDGPGDGDGDGLADWGGPVVFFRYPHPGVESGTHTFDFHTYFGGDWSDTITVEALE